MMNYMNPYLSNPYMQQSVQQMPQMPQYQQQAGGVNNIIQVNGPNSALQFAQRMGPNSTSPALFDVNGKVFYIVTTDGAGMGTLETFDFLPHVVETEATIDTSQYVTRSEFNDSINELKEAINGIHGPVQAATAVGDPAAAGTGIPTAADAALGQQAR